MHALLCGQVLFSNLTLSELVVMGGGGGGGGRRGRGRGRGRGYDGLGPYGVVAGVFTCDAFILMGLLGLLVIRCRSGLTRAPRGNEDHINTEVIADSNVMGHGDTGGTREEALEHSGIVFCVAKSYSETTHCQSMHTVDCLAFVCGGGACVCVCGVRAPLNVFVHVCVPACMPFCVAMSHSQATHYQPACLSVWPNHNLQPQQTETRHGKPKSTTAD